MLDDMFFIPANINQQDHTYTLTCCYQDKMLVVNQIMIMYDMLQHILLLYLF